MCADAGSGHKTRRRERGRGRARAAPRAAPQAAPAPQTSAAQSRPALGLRREAAPLQERAKSRAKSKKMASSKRGKRMVARHGFALEEPGPEPLGKWIARSRAGIYEPTWTSGSYCTLVGSWNFEDRLKEVLQNIALLQTHLTVTRSPGDREPMGVLDSISAKSGKLKAVALSVPNVVLGKRRFEQDTQIHDEEQRRLVAKRLFVQLSSLLRALLLSFVSCSAVKAGELQISDALKFDVASHSIVPSALKECDDETVLAAGRALLAMLGSVA
uniref:Uncharacterized protein n=1 Tax=Pinguiococcus pyrenoidosus TaxID=172671 RepID=A0A7R9U8N5_9STRA